MQNRRQQSTPPMMVIFQDLDLSSTQSQRGFRLQWNITILEIKNHIKKFLDDNCEIELYFEKDQVFNGNLNTYAYNIIKNLPKRVIYYKKMLLQQVQQSYIYKQQNTQQQIYDNNFSNNITQNERNTQREYQPVNRQNQQINGKMSYEQNTKSSQIIGPSDQNNYLNNKRITPNIKLTKAEDIKNSNNIQQNEFEIQNSQQFINSNKFLNQSYQQQTQLNEFANQSSQIQPKQLNQQSLNQQQLQNQEIKLQNQDSYKRYSLNAQMSPTLDNKKDQISIQNSQLYQSKINQQQNNYRNKCGHYLDISQIQQQVFMAIRDNIIALCNSCQTPIQNKLCLLIQDYGKTCLEKKSQIELKNIAINIDKKLKYNEKLLKCQNNICPFFCIWQNYQKVNYGSNSRQVQQQNGYCPMCLKYCIEINNKNYSQQSPYQIQLNTQNVQIQHNYNKNQEENQQLKQENISLLNELQENKIRLQSQIDSLNKEIEKNNLLNSYNKNTYQEELKKLKNENMSLQNELNENKIKFQSIIDALNKELEINNQNKKIQFIHLTQQNKKFQEENQKLQNQNISLSKQLHEISLQFSSQIEANKKLDTLNNKQKEEILNLNNQNKLLEQFQQKFQEDFINICDLSNIQMKKIQDMRIQNHDCLSKLTFKEIKDSLKYALRTQKQIYCNCLEEQLLPINKLKQLLSILELYINMIYNKQLSTLIRIQKNAQLPIYKCSSNNCNFIFILKNDQENQEIQINQQFYCQNCKLMCSTQRI